MTPNLRKPSLFWHIFLLISLFPHVLWAQPKIPVKQLRATHFSASDGLVDDGLWAMVQDEQGVLWLGTQMGLVKYDGIELELIPLGDLYTRIPLKAPSIQVRALTIGPEGDPWIANGRGDLYRYDRRRGKYFYYLNQNRGEGGPGKIRGIARSITIDPDRNIWVGTYGAGIFRLRLDAWGSPSEESSVVFVQEFSQQKNNFITDMAEYLVQDSQGNIWAATDRGLAKWDEEQETFIYFYFRPEGGQEAAEGFYGIDYGEADGKIWLTSRSGRLVCFDPATREFSSSLFSSSVSSRQPAIWLGHVLLDRQGKVWVNYLQDQYLKLGRYHPENGLFEEIRFQFDRPLSGPFNLDIRVFTEDKNGNIWIGAHNGGLTRYSPSRSVFQWIRPGPEEKALWEADPIGKVAVDGIGHVWLISDHQHLVRWDPEQEVWTRFPDPSFPLKARSSLYANSGLLSDSVGNIWLRTDDKLLQYEVSQQQFVDMGEKYPLFYQKVAKEGIRGFGVDSQGRWWIASLYHLYRFDPVANEVSKVIDHSALPAGHENTDLGELYIDRSDCLWLGTANGGFFRYEPESDSLLYFNYSPGRIFLEDPRGFLYVGTYGNGVVRINLQDLETETITTRDGLPSNKVRGGLALDQSGKVWIGTNHGLACYDPFSQKINTFTTADGLPSNMFTSIQTGKTRDGYLIFGTHLGLVRFHPDSIGKDTQPPQLLFKDLILFDKTILPEDGGPLQQSLAFTKEIQLQHWQNDLTVSFVALHFKNPEKNEYAVRLEPYQREWRSIGQQNFTSFTNLAPGKYTFRVKAANSDGIWNEEGIALNITIHPPWYWNGWSQALYLILLLGIAFSIYRFQLNRRLALAEANRLQELDQVKSQLYTNVTHEFRTPLTIMQGLTDELRKDFKGRAAEKLGLIRRNGEHLLRLVNQLLDIARLETGQVRLEPVQANVAPFLGYLTESFHSWAERRHIRLSFFSDEDEVVMDYDPLRLQQVVSNLLSNALKFTPAYGKVAVGVRRLAPDRLEIKVKDNGPGIAEVHLPRIFDRFYQVDATSTRKGEGTGIGLALTRELVGLMGGTVTVDSTVGKGTTFTVTLPITRKAPLEKGTVALATESVLPPVSAAGEEKAVPSSGKDLPLLLIVEDNADVRYYLRTCLAGTHRIEEANNGKEGLDKALELVPDVIISDVMMPELDGFELCEQLKGDPRTSHIPLILLTARATAEDRLQGLRTGADAYLAKPFSREELEVRLAQLVELRRKLRERFSNGWTGLADLPQEDPEAAFMKKLNETIAQNLSEEDFGVKELSRALTMSRMQLHRKLTALTGLSTSDYLKQARLHHARELLRKTDLRVGEVAARVGFKGHSHFSRAYRELFGEAPSTGRL